MILPSIAAIPHCTWSGRHEFAWTASGIGGLNSVPDWAICQWCRQQHGVLAAQHLDGDA
jgi:hypothetical protein